MGLLLLLVALLPTAGYLIWAARTKPRPDRACRACGYDLQSLGDDGHCPECGAPFRS